MSLSQCFNKQSEDSIHPHFQGKYINTRNHINRDKHMAQTAVPRSGGENSDLK